MSTSTRIVIYNIVVLEKETHDRSRRPVGNKVTRYSVDSRNKIFATDRSRRDAAYFQLYEKGGKAVIDKIRITAAQIKTKHLTGFWENHAY